MTQDSHTQMRDYAESIMALPCDPYAVQIFDYVTPIVWELSIGHWPANPHDHRDTLSVLDVD